MRKFTSPGPLRLLVLTDSPITISGGSERFLRNLMTGLPASHFQITVVQLCEEPPSACSLHGTPIASVSDEMFLPFGALYGWRGLRALRRVRAMVRQHGYHVIQSQHEKSDVFNALLPRGPLHAAKISNRRDAGFMKSPRLRGLLRLLNRRYDRIVAPARSILDMVAKGEHASQASMQCIPNGVDTVCFHPLDICERNKLRISLGWAQDELQIGCAAELSPVKRHSDLIDAFARVYTELPKARLNLIGDGELRTAIEQQIDALGLGSAVRLLGRRKDIPALLPALDLFVLASDTEGLSNAILEAQGCGLPIVATRVGGNPELVNTDTGILVDAKRPTELAAAMLKLLRDCATRTQMGAAGRAMVEREYSLAAMVQAYETLYAEVRHAT